MLFVAGLTLPASAETLVDNIQEIREPKQYALTIRLFNAEQVLFETQIAMLDEQVVVLKNSRTYGQESAGKIVPMDSLKFMALLDSRRNPGQGPDTSGYSPAIQMAYLQSQHIGIGALGVDVYMPGASSYELELREISEDYEWPIQEGSAAALALMSGSVRGALAPVSDIGPQPKRLEIIDGREVMIDGGPGENQVELAGEE
jgi:hypothetical protein